MEPNRLHLRRIWVHILCQDSRRPEIYEFNFHYYLVDTHPNEFIVQRIVCHCRLSSCTASSLEFGQCPISYHGLFDHLRRPIVVIIRNNTMRRNPPFPHDQSLFKRLLLVVVPQVMSDLLKVEFHFPWLVRILHEFYQFRDDTLLPVGEQFQSSFTLVLLHDRFWKAGQVRRQRLVEL